VTQGIDEEGEWAHWNREKEERAWLLIRSRRGAA
jgi:hypothetical protein